MTKLSNAGAVQPLEAVRGATFGPVFGRIRRQGSVAGDEDAYVDLTGCTVRGWVRKNPNDQSDAAVFVCEVRDQTEVRGGYSFMLPATALSLLSIGQKPDSLASRYQYRIEIVEPAPRTRVTALHGGAFNITWS